MKKNFKIHIFFVCLCMVQLCLPVYSIATTYYATNNSTKTISWGVGSNTNNGLSKASPFESIKYASSHMEGGDTLIIADGTYKGDDNMINTNKFSCPPEGTSDSYTTIMSENEGRVIIDGEGIRAPILLIGDEAAEGKTISYDYIAIKGIIASNSPVDNDAIRVEYANHIKLINCGAFNAGDNNGKVFNLNGASYILLEGCYAWGSGHYKIYLNNVQKSIVRNCVVRHDRCISTQSMGGIVLNKCSEIEIQNAIVIDSNQPQYYQNYSSDQGCLKAIDTNYVVDRDSISFTNCIVLNNSIQSGIPAKGSNQENVFFNNCIDESSNEIDFASNLFKMHGKVGTLWGEAGYNLLQDGTNGQDIKILWPFPNEDIIKEKMAQYSYDNGKLTGKRGFCSDGKQLNGKDKITLTSYILEYFGNPLPTGIIDNKLLVPGNIRLLEEKLKWDKSTGAKGYRIFHGTSYNNYQDIKNVGSVTEYPITSLVSISENESFFAIQAYNDSGSESALSQCVVYTKIKSSEIKKDTSPPQMASIESELHYVRPAGQKYGLGNGSSYGNAWNGFSNIQWGTGNEKGKVDAGETLYVCGTHFEQLTFAPSGKDNAPITISGDYKGDPGIIDGKNVLSNAIKAQLNTYIKFSSFEIQNTKETAFDLYNSGKETLPRNIEILNCIIHDAGKNGISITGDYVTIDNCKIYNIGEDGIYARGAKLTITNSNVYNVAQDTNSDGDCIQISNRGADFYVAHNELINMNPASKQCFVAHGYDSGGVFEYNTCKISTLENKSHFPIQINQKDVFVRQNTFEGGSYAGVFLFGKVEYNIFKNATICGIRVSTPDSEKGVGNVELYNNIIQNCPNGVFHDSETKLELKNNIIFGSTKYGIKVNTPGIPTINSNYNCLFNNTKDYFGIKKDSDPLNKNTDAIWSEEAYELLKESPCQLN